VRSGSGFGMVLHGEQGQLPVAHALDGTVVQVEVGNLEPGRARDAVRVANYREAMVMSTWLLRRSRTGWLPPR
jgi:hypothetical protein